MAPRDRADDDKVSILLVDDRPDKLLVLEAILAELGRQPRAALRDHRAVGNQMAAGVAGMRDIGVRVLACRNTMARWSRELAGKSGETADAVQAKMLKGLSPGVEPVPAMIAAAVLAQARNAAYITIG